MCVCGVLHLELCVYAYGIIHMHHTMNNIHVHKEKQPNHIKLETRGCLCKLCNLQIHAAVETEVPTKVQNMQRKFEQFRKQVAKITVTSDTCML